MTQKLDMTHSSGYLQQEAEGGDVVSKRARKKRDRKKNAASHGKRPNS